MTDLVASEDVVLREDSAPVDVGALALRDFHVLRAIATRLGWLAEESIEIACRNCGAAIHLQACAALELGPFVDGELDDRELDGTLDLSVAHAIPLVSLGRGRSADAVTLRDLTVADAQPFHRALRRRRLVLTERVVRGMGIDCLGAERDPRLVADALADCSDHAWGAIGDLFLHAHYLPRLSSLVLCAKCGAKNVVDAPYDREFEPSEPAAQSNEEVFPDLDAFDVRARAFFDEHAGANTSTVRLVIDAGVPACDDGGDPLLGAYLPPGGDPAAPIGSAEITLYYRTFRAICSEDGHYDWEAEVAETIEHELEHHAGWRMGHDPLDDDEHDEIARERARIVGRKTTVRDSLGAFGADFRGFLAATWPIWLIVAAATVAVTVCNR